MIILYELEFDLDEFMWPRPADRRTLPMSEQHPDQIDMMDEHELRTEIRSVLLRLSACEKERDEWREHYEIQSAKQLRPALERAHAAESRLEKTENQNRFLRSWIRELREDGADAVSVDPLYGMLRDRITELAKEDPAADSPEGARLTALAELCEAYETRRGESAVGAPEVNSKSRLKRVAMQRAARESDAGVERQEPESTG